jgi:geranylgeranyl diphosphate synthase type II
LIDPIALFDLAKIAICRRKQVASRPGRRFGIGAERWEQVRIFNWLIGFSDCRESLQSWWLFGAAADGVPRTHSFACRTLTINYSSTHASSLENTIDTRSPHLAVTDVESFLKVWQALQGEVDVALDRSLRELGVNCPARLQDAIRYSLLAPGKRLRPVLCLLASHATGGGTSNAMKCAVALEMMHCYSLIHDDLPAMDDDDLRRGRPTCHKQFDEATAILAGDALQPFAFQAILNSSLSAESAAECCRVLAASVGPEGMVGGQMDDLLAEQRDIPGMPIDEQKSWLEAIHRRKTGALLQASVELGAIAGGASPADRAALCRYGRSLGIAFQIVDDLLDVESTPENTGKATGKDSARGKLTFPAVYGIAASREQAHRWTEESIRVIQPLGETSVPLQWLAKYVLERSH